MRLKCVVAAVLASSGVEAADLRFDGEAIAWQPVTVSADLGCSEFDGVSNEGGVIRIATKRPEVAGCDPNAKPRAITIGSFPAGEQAVELYYEATKVAAISVSVAEANSPAGAPAFSVDGWWAANRGDGNGLLLQRGPDGRLYGSLMTYDDAGAPTFLTFQGWSWYEQDGSYSGPLFRTRGTAFASPTSVPPDTVSVGNGRIFFETVQCLVAPCEVNPDRLSFGLRIGGVERTTSFDRVEFPR